MVIDDGECGPFTPLHASIDSIHCSISVLFGFLYFLWIRTLILTVCLLIKRTAMAIGILGRLAEGIGTTKGPIVYSTGDQQGIHIWVIGEFGGTLFQ